MAELLRGPLVTIPVIRVSDVVKWGEALSDTLGKLDSAHLARPVGGAAGARGGELTHNSPRDQIY